VLETPHVLVGAAIAAKIPNPYLAIPLSLGSHFVLDILPHWNPHINREIKKYGKPTQQSVSIIAGDSSLALMSGLLIAFSNPNPWLILTSCFVAVLPDLVEAPYYFLGKKTLIVEKWIQWQKSIQNDVEMLPGLLSQIVIALGAILWIFT